MDNHRLALPPGFRIENYEIQAVLGKGGFGITYAGYDWTLHRHMAIKELLPDSIATRIEGSTVVAMSPSHEENWQWARERFIEEARILAGFRHPNIIAVHRLIEANGTAYIVMDHLEGESYEARLQKIGREPDQESLMRVIGPILDGLQEVHAGGLLHRDIKPENILFDKRGNPVLIDFGSARATVGATMAMTSIVTHGYSPIEQYQTKGKMGPWTDIYAVGAVMYRAITGEKPPAATDRLAGDDFQLLSNRVLVGFDKSLLFAIDAALRVDVTGRPKQIQDWRSDLDSGVVLENTSKAETSSTKAQVNECAKEIKKKNAKRNVILVLLFISLVFAGLSLLNNFQVFYKSISYDNGAILGSQRSDILYLLGKPHYVHGPLMDGGWRIVYDVAASANDVNSLPSDTKIEDYNEWDYEEIHGHGSSLTVSFDDENKVISLGLYSKPDGGPNWGPVAGVKDGDDEDVIYKLGKPTSTSMLNEIMPIGDVTKVIEYADIGLTFYLKKRKVYMVVYKRPTNGIGAVIYRYICVLIP